MDKSTLSPSEGGKKNTPTYPILIGVAIAVLVCGAAAFALGALLFYRPQIISLGSTATPTKTPKAVATSSPATDTPAPTDTPLPPTNPPPATDTPVPDPPTAEPPPTDTPEPPTATPTPRPAKPLHMNSPEYGMQAFLWWRAETA
ncbi:MAG: hypothetical protein GTN71_26845, partial [Anaerolineae bacterium]|nr:hypothetical protein [Anaerolineae bacterium]